MANLIGTGLNQVPTNGLLGNMAFQNKEAVSMDLLTTTGNVGIGTTSPRSVTNYVGLTLNGASGSFIDFNTAGTRYGTIFGTSGALDISTTSTIPITFGTNATERMRLDSAGNLGLGVTPSAWRSTVKAFEGPAGSVYDFSTTSKGVAQNAFLDSVGWKYKTTAAASLYEQIGGAHSWNTAPSGTAGNAITFTQAMTLTAAGSLGVGTTSPNIAGVSNAVTVNTINGTTGAIYEIGINGTNYAYLFANVSNTVLSSVQSTPLLFNTNNTERMRLDANGNLGIGTSSPGGKLDVAGAGLVARFGSTSALNAYTSWAFNNTTLGYMGNGAGVVSGGGSTDFGIGSTGARPLIFGTNDLERMRLDSSGNLLLGSVSNPDGAKIFVNAGTQIGASLSAVGGTGAEVVVLKLYANASASASARISFSTAANTASHSFISAQTLSATDSTLTFGTNNTERARITATGDVGIGTSSPAAKLDVYGGTSGSTTNVAVGNAATAFVVGVDSSNNCQVRTGQNVSINFYTNAAERMRITGAGNLQLGTASLATTATDGFPYIPTCAGTPTGTPTAITGYAPMVVDSTNNKLYVYVGGAWQAMN